MTVDPKTYQELAARTECDQARSVARLACLPMSRTRDYDQNQLRRVRLNHSIIGMAGEVGELAGALEKWIYYGRELDRENVIEEYGDLLWYIALGLNALGLDMGDVMKANIMKLKSRFPDCYTDQDSLIRNHEAELASIRGVINATQGVQKAYTAPPAAPVLAYKCINCRDTGLVTDEWDTVNPSPCPVCRKGR